MLSVSDRIQIPSKTTHKDTGIKENTYYRYKVISFSDTVKPCFTDTRLIWTPHYYGQFALSLGKESPLRFL